MTIPYALLPLPMPSLTIFQSIVLRIFIQVPTSAVDLCGNGGLEGWGLVWLLLGFSPFRPVPLAPMHVGSSPQDSQTACLGALVSEKVLFCPLLQSLTETQTGQPDEPVPAAALLPPANTHLVVQPYLCELKKRPFVPAVLCAWRACV